MIRKEEDDPQRYDDIINLPRHVSLSRPQMAVSDRAAQFSPVAALTGYESAVKETARLTDRRIELNEDEKETLDQKLLIIKECLKGQLKERPSVSVTYFVPDEKKEGGHYATVTGSIKQLSEYKNLLVLWDGTGIPLSDIADIDGEIFWPMER